MVTVRVPRVVRDAAVGRARMSGVPLAVKLRAAIFGYAGMAPSDVEAGSLDAASPRRASAVAKTVDDVAAELEDLVPPATVAPKRPQPAVRHDPKWRDHPIFGKQCEVCQLPKARHP